MLIFNFFICDVYKLSSKADFSFLIICTVDASSRVVVLLKRKVDVLKGLLSISRYEIKNTVLMHF